MRADVLKPICFCIVLPPPQHKRESADMIDVVINKLQVHWQLNMDIRAECLSLLTHSTRTEKGKDGTQIQSHLIRWALYKMDQAPNPTSHVQGPSDGNAQDHLKLSNRGHSSVIKPKKKAAMCTTLASQANAQETNKHFIISKLSHTTCE